MNAKRFKIISTILLAGTLTLFLAGCGGGGGGDDDGGPETASVTIGAPEPASVQSAGSGTLSTGNFPEIKSVKVEVYDGVPTINGDKHTVTGTLLTQFTTFLVVSGSSWGGSIGGLPVGQALTFVGRAFTSGDGTPIPPTEPDPASEVFTGATTASLIAGPNGITIVMGPHTINFNIPQIAPIRKPAEIKIGTTADIDADVGYIKTSYDLDYLFTGAGGTYTAGASGTVTTDLLGDATIPAATFFAGITTGDFVQSLSVSDPVGPVTGEREFTLTLVSGEGDATIVTEFAPTVSSMTVRKLATSSTVEFTAGVSDDGTVVSFLWEYLGTGTPTFDPLFKGVNDANPGSMVNYDPAAGGDVSLQVTDDSGLTTTVTFPLPVFPDDVIVTVFDFESGTTQGWATSGLWHVTNSAGHVIGGLKSMWFGDEATGDAGSAAVSGVLTLLSTNLGATPFLKLDYLHDILKCVDSAGPPVVTCPTLTVTVGDGERTVGPTTLAPGVAVNTSTSIDLSALDAFPVDVTIAYSNDGSSGATFAGPVVDNIRVDKNP